MNKITKNILLTTLAFLLTGSCIIASTGTNTYIDSLLNCKNYEKSFDGPMTLPNNPSQPTLVNISEKIIGLQNNKCIIETTVTEKQSNLKVMSIKCKYTYAKRSEIARSYIKLEKDNGNNAKVLAFQDQFLSNVLDRNVCETKAYKLPEPAAQNANSTNKSSSSEQKYQKPIRMRQKPGQ